VNAMISRFAGDGSGMAKVLELRTPYIVKGSGMYADVLPTFI
jgi:hypothetical protein